MITQFLHHTSIPSNDKLQVFRNNYWESFLQGIPEKIIHLLYHITQKGEGQPFQWAYVSRWQLKRVADEKIVSWMLFVYHGNVMLSTITDGDGELWVDMRRWLSHREDQGRLMGWEFVVV